MIFNVKTIGYSAPENWNVGIQIDLVAENGNQLCLSAELKDLEIRIAWPLQSRDLTCGKKDFSYFPLPEQMVVKVRNSAGNNGMNGEPIVLELPPDLDNEKLIRALKVLVLH